MKKLHPALQAIALALILACSDRGSEQPQLDGPGDETTPETRPENPTSVEAPSVRDKLTCPAGCVKVSASPPSPSCCSCNGQDRTWKRSTWSATTWLCQ